MVDEFRIFNDRKMKICTARNVPFARVHVTYVFYSCLCKYLPMHKLRLSQLFQLRVTCFYNARVVKLQFILNFRA